MRSLPFHLFFFFFFFSVCNLSSYGNSVTSSLFNIVSTSRHTGSSFDIVLCGIESLLITSSPFQPWSSMYPEYIMINYLPPLLVIPVKAPQIIQLFPTQKSALLWFDIIVESHSGNSPQGSQPADDDHAGHVQCLQPRDAVWLDDNYYWYYGVEYVPLCTEYCRSTSKWRCGRQDNTL